MKDFLNAARLLLLDLASTLFFLVVYLLTHNTILAVGLGIALGSHRSEPSSSAASRSMPWSG